MLTTCCPLACISSHQLCKVFLHELMTKRTCETYDAALMQNSTIVRYLGNLQILRIEIIPEEYWVFDPQTQRLGKFADFNLALSNCLNLHYQKIDRRNLMALRAS